VNRRRFKPGFTLVEMLVVLLITVLLVGSAAALMRVIAGAREVAENRLQGEQEAMVALRTITTTIRNAYRPITDDVLLFEGTGDPSGALPMSRLRLRAIDRRIIRQGQPESDVHEIEFFIRDDGSRPTLMRRSDPTKNLLPDGGGVVEPLASDVVGLDLQYFDAGKWEDSWPEKMQRLPTAVNVRLVYRADSAGKKLSAVSEIVNIPHWSSKAAATPAQGGATGATPTGGGEEQ